MTMIFFASKLPKGELHPPVAGACRSCALCRTVAVRMKLSPRSAHRAGDLFPCLRGARWPESQRRRESRSPSGSSPEAFVAWSRDVLDAAVAVVPRLRFAADGAVFLDVAVAGVSWSRFAADGAVFLDVAVAGVSWSRFAALGAVFLDAAVAGVSWLRFAALGAVMRRLSLETLTALVIRPQPSARSRPRPAHRSSEPPRGDMRRFQGCCGARWRRSRRSSAGVGRRRRLLQRRGRWHLPDAGWQLGHRAVIPGRCPHGPVRQYVLFHLSREHDSQPWL